MGLGLAASEMIRAAPSGVGPSDQFHQDPLSNTAIGNPEAGNRPCIKYALQNGCSHDDHIRAPLSDTGVLGSLVVVHGEDLLADSVSIGSFEEYTIDSFAIIFF